MPPTKKQLVIGGVAAGLAIGGIAFAVSRKSKKANADDDTAFTAPLKPIVEQTPQPTAAAVATESSAQFTREYSFRPNEDNERMLEEALTEQLAQQQKAPKVTTANKADGSTTFAHLGVSLVPPPGWLVREEPSPMPNVAMITVTKPEFAEKQMSPEDMGSVPIIILSVEDISGENLDIFEFKEKSKQMALTQMMMMTNGMVQPQMKFDEQLTVGPFRHCLEYAQALPPVFELAVCNLLAVQGGLAYVFQIMCSPKVMNTYKPTFMDIARTFKLVSSGDAAIGCLKITAPRLALEIAPSWSWTVPTKGAALLEFVTPSTTKSEQIALFETANAPSTSSQSEKVVDGVTIRKVVDGRNESKEFVFGGFTAIVKPLQKPSVQINEAHVISMMKSAKLATASAENAVYINSDHGYSFDVVRGSRVIASRVGGGTVVYAPMGIPADPNRQQEPEESGPTVTIRVGDPENDPDCAESLDAWEERMEAEKASGHITGVLRTRLSGLPCLTFQSKDMQEVGPGQRLEVVGKVFIFVRDGRTTLIRWETPTGLWRKFEPKMERFMDSLKFL